jgi:phytoene/squalene synthetase
MLAREGSLTEAAQHAIHTATLIRRGRGKQAILAMSEDEAHELADYFWSVAGVVGDMTAAERNGGSEHKAAQQAVLRIEAAIRTHK